MEWKIGNVTIKNQIVMAPMAGFSNTSFRKIVKEMGVGLIYAEMVSDKALVYQSQKTIDMLKMDEMERPIAQQIFGSDKTSFVQAALYVEKVMKPDIIDINMGCPVPKVALKNQAGSALLKNPLKVKEIVSEVVQHVKIPVTVKIRSGWDENNINAVQIAKVIEEAGAKAICVHARTRSQGYSGHADWKVIREVKKSVSIPVIGNGDVTSPELAQKMLFETGCDAVMIGRGLLGNPWLVKACLDYLESGHYSTISSLEKVDMMKKHFEMLKNDKNEQVALLEIRTNLLYYLKGMPKNKEIKQLVCQTKTETDLQRVLEDYFIYLKENNL
ncbi:MAG: tRNA dihydrouridine synthase DusB [Bacilli bacterium]|jgi:nifR3 family TIM-barrel protein|nr:tRNA dihydrouridine synthase DusB [Bacilli bacterium]